MAGTGDSKALPFNREVLRWARNRLRYDFDVPAKRLNVPPDRIAAWEDGNGTPTVIQGRKLAALYDRPFLEFFSDTIPELAPTSLVPDFRFHSGVTPDREAVALLEIHRWAEEQRLNALDLLELVGDEPPAFPERLYASIDESVDSAAARAREIIDFTIDRQFSLNARERDQLPNYLRKTFEQCGILVLRQTGLDKLRTRGICLFATPVPIIVYGSEAPGAQAFTLVHEFAHILLKQSAISGLPRFGRSAGAKKIEGWCNNFAAAFLIPRDAIEADMGAQPKMADALPDDLLAGLAKKYAVSRHAMLIRLVGLQFVKPAFYWFKKRPEFLQEESEFESFGRPSYYGSRYRSSRGDFYTGLVMEAWTSGSITNHNASEFMGIENLTHLYDIRSNFGN